MESSPQLVHQTLEEFRIPKTWFEVYLAQDIMRLDNTARMNFPGTVKNNWTWRIGDHGIWQRLEKESNELRLLLKIYDRLAPSIRTNKPWFLHTRPSSSLLNKHTLDISDDILKSLFMGQSLQKRLPWHWFASRSDRTCLAAIYCKWHLNCLLVKLARWTIRLASKILCKGNSYRWLNCYDNKKQKPFARSGNTKLAQGITTWIISCCTPIAHIQKFMIACKFAKQNKSSKLQIFDDRVWVYTWRLHQSSSKIILANRTFLTTESLNLQVTSTPDFKNFLQKNRLSDRGLLAVQSRSQQTVSASIQWLWQLIQNLL